ncbi:MAG: PH domain-containing protein [Phycisphaeraceae bacterium]|nr:MAG: PH domain-containing protein [Phycisphaeraceae bacterium]
MRPSIWRGSPWQSVGLLLTPLVVAGITAAFASGGRFRYAALAFGIGAAVAWIPLFVWWLFSTMGVSMEITNKRTIERHGLLSRRSSEVMHDHVRNITIDQSFVDRVLRVGEIGISSAGQGGIEIHVRSLPHPKRIKGVIDLYRPL